MGGRFSVSPAHVFIYAHAHAPCRRYLTVIRKEKEAFEHLIHEKSVCQSAYSRGGGSGSRILSFSFLGFVIDCHAGTPPFIQGNWFENSVATSFLSSSLTT